MKKLLLVSAVTVLVLIMAACGSNNSANNNAPENGAATETSAAAANEVVIKASNWEFDKEVYTIKKGEATTITLDADGVHGIEIPALNVKLTNGKSQDVTIADAGEYELHCNIPCGNGHTQMVAKIKVE
ncbi:cupredoxin domain-containing protein [Paenibacillus sepulcri]|uniref:Cupredoxin domain-containing protein n=1 Tax=Paenibacillus sepulcri TaxID=359917 RepID=A0ABS7CDV9_9BACL|nr:cupredoxin domain-containing protein [Paenibacillus sepulcri]